MTTLPNAISEGLIDYFQETELYISLHTADPGKTGANEATGVPRVPVLADERQTVTITGTPTGGTFTLSYDGQTTAGIAYNANAAAVQSALEALSNIGVGDVTVSGGALPGTPVVVRFTGALERQDVDDMTANGAGLTGGSSPAVAVVETQKGVEGFGAAVDHVATNGRREPTDVLLEFGEATAAETYTHGGVWDAKTGGNFKGGNALNSDVTVAIDDPVQIVAGDFGIVGAGIA
jgi:hypothetical protein